MPDEMFICNANFSEWVYFNRSVIVLDPTPPEHVQGVNVLATNRNSSPHLVHVWRRTAHSIDPLISNLPSAASELSEQQADNFLYAENSTSNWNPGKGSLISVWLKPLPFA